MSMSGAQMNDFSAALACLREYSTAADALAENRRTIENEGFTLLAWARFAPASVRGRAVHGGLLRKLSRELMVKLLKLDEVPAHWLAQNGRDLLAGHVGSLAFLAVQMSVRDSQIWKKPEYFLHPDRYGLEKLVSHIVAILRCYGVLRSHIEFDAGMEILQDALRGEEEKRQARVASRERRRLVREGEFWADEVTAVKLAKRYRSSSCSLEEREEIKAFFFPERESDFDPGEDGFSVEHLYSSTDGLEDPVLGGLLAREAEEAETGESGNFGEKFFVPGIRGITAAGLADLVVRGIESGATTAERAVSVFGPFERRRELLDRLVCRAEHSDVAREVCFCLAERVERGTIELGLGGPDGRRNRSLRERILEEAARLREIPPTALDAVIPLTPPATRQYFPADGLPEEPSDVPPSLDCGPAVPESGAQRRDPVAGRKTRRKKREPEGVIGALYRPKSGFRVEEVVYG